MPFRRKAPVFIIEPKGDSSRAVEFIQRTRRIAVNYPNVTCLNMRDFIRKSSEQHHPTHFDRMVYYRLFREIVDHWKNAETRSELDAIRGRPVTSVDFFEIVRKLVKPQRFSFAGGRRGSGTRR